MDEDVFNMQLRKFLKKVGITSQREIEQAVRAAIADGSLSSGTPLDATVTVKLPALGVEFDVQDKIGLK
ncbi:MAG: DUF6494 family protein [Pseudomonadota bacterium]